MMNNGVNVNPATISKHKVLLFGRKLFSDYESRIYSHSNADIDVIPFPDEYYDLKRLANYTLVVTDYAPFHDQRGVHKEQQNIFDKLAVEALEAGTTICFVHYDEVVPREDQYSHSTGYMDEDDCTELKESQLGFRILSKLSIRPLRADQPFLTSTIKRGVFQPFLSKWGASHNCFMTYEDGKFDDIIVGPSEYPMGFSMQARRGLIIFLPFQRDFKREKDLLQGIHTLLDCLLTYITKMQETLPDWSTTSFFKEEELLYKEYQQIEEDLQRKSDEIKPFAVAKQLLCQAEYKLEQTVPDFIQEHLGIKTERGDHYAEDFWILNDSGERIAICEVKSHVKGCKRSSIYSIFSHRDTNKLDNTFPAILFVNHHIQTASWAAKDRPINKEDYQVAAKDNILVLRIEDLVRLWAAKRNGLISSDALLITLTTSKGWLKVDSSLNINLLPVVS